MLRRFGPILLGLGAAACGSSVGRQPALPPVSLVDAPAEAQVGAGPGSSAVDGAPAVARTLDLREFQPLLAEARLVAIREAMAEGEYEEAATQLGAWMDERPPQAQDKARFSYLLGSLLHLAGDNERAQLELVPAVEIDWVLQGDARLLLAEVSLAQKKWTQALGQVRALPEEVDVGRETAIQAEALFGLESYAEAAELYGLLAELQPDGWSRLRLARCLLALAEKQAALDEASASDPSTESLEWASRALREARLATVGLSEDSGVARAAAQVEQAARRLGAKDEGGREELALIHAEKLVDARLFNEAEEVTAGIETRHPLVWDRNQCLLDYLKAKILAGQRQWGAGADRLRNAASHCESDPSLHAKILFNAGKFSAADSRNTAAAAYYEQLERLYPNDSLADDSRLRRARAYLDAGVVSRFTELLLALPEDYPDGDMTMEGVLELALYRIERSDWAGASVVLERGTQAVAGRDSARGHEEAGRERYFWARALGETGDEEGALREYEIIVRELPLSYYMLHAYSRLKEASPERAEAALSSAIRRAELSPFSFPYREEYDSLRFRRGMELLRVGELERGRTVLGELGLGANTDDSLLWGLALLHDRAGDAHVSHRIARGRLTDWLSHYPEGDWRRPWEIGFPRPYYDIVQRESTKTGVPEWFIYGVMREESTFDARVKSHADAYGLMQLIIPTARAFARKEGLPASPSALKRPSINIALGARVLESLSKRFQKNPWLAIPGYNAGPGRPIRWMRERSDVDFDVWVEMIPFRETRRYTKRVLASRAAYAFVYYRQDAEQALTLPKRLEAR